MSVPLSNADITLTALCAAGAEKVLGNELRKLSLPIVDTGFGKVRFRAGLAGTYRALMELRTADRLLWEAACFRAEDFDDLFEGVRNAPWERFIPRGMGLAVDKVRVSRSVLQGLTSIQAQVHKAAADRLCAKYRVSRLPEGPSKAEIRVHIEKDEVRAMLDLSGEALFKRGYRREGGIAPLRETTAAALLLLSLWKRKFPLYDPFCGSGTIPIEAALYAWDLAPGLGRDFALSSMVPADKALERRIREELLARADFSRTIRIYGSDGDAGAVALARANLERALAVIRGRAGQTGGLPSGEPPALPVFKVSALGAVQPPVDEPGFIITNPPYGRRLGEPEEAEALYRELAVLGERFPRWKLGLITDHEDFEDYFGSAADSRREISNGAVKAYFYQYEVLKKGTEEHRG
ncbi:MAG: class I SAM-dependent RNA methyltransferase [Treponema sp.]|nr:class I SAM-dependent RNA methyltransferase [Treponema sp.]